MGEKVEEGGKVAVLHHQDGANVVEDCADIVADFELLLGDLLALGTTIVSGTSQSDEVAR